MWGSVPFKFEEFSKYETRRPIEMGISLMSGVLRRRSVAIEAQHELLALPRMSSSYVELWSRESGLFFFLIT